MSRRLTDQERLWRTVSEDALQRDVVAAARRFGWLVHHGRPGRDVQGGGVRTHVQGHVGFVDLVLVKRGRPGRVIFAELKRQVAQPGPEQQAWLAALASAPAVEVYVWRPSDMAVVMEVLTS